METKNEMSDLIRSLITKFNSNPLNPKKFYFQETETVHMPESEGEERKCSFQIEFGVSKATSMIFKTSNFKREELEQNKKRLYADFVEKLFNNIYDRIDSDTFSTNGYSKIIRENN